MKKPRKKSPPQPEPKLAPPDWNNDHITYTNSSANNPRPWTLRWPNEHQLRRRIIVDFDSWRGIALGASHFYVKIREEQNAAWDGKEICWVIYRDHADMKIRKFEADVFTREEAAKFVESVVGTFFSDDKIYRITDGSTETEEGVQSILTTIRKDR